MTETMGTTPGAATPTSADAATRDVAKEEARGVAQDAVVSGKQTAETAKQQAGEVAGEAMSQARMLLDQTREQVTSQSLAQQERAASGLRSLADELSGLVSGTAHQEGLATDLARQASERVRTAADFIENRQPGELLDEVRSFARRRPGTFLLGAAAIGFLGGRLTRGLADEARDDSPAPVTTGTAPTPSTAVPPVQPVQPVTSGVSEAAPAGPGYSVSPEHDPAGDATAQLTPTTPGLAGNRPEEGRI